VDCYLTYFRHWLITCPLSALLTSSLCLLKVCEEISSLPLPPSPVLSGHTAPSAACPFQFLVYYSVFLGGVGVSLPRGLPCFVTGEAVKIPCAAYVLTCWSASPKQVWSHHLEAWEPSCFLSVMWHGGLYGVGVQNVRVLILLGVFFLPSVAPESQQNF
jgi:hypothetical protein